ncbi:MAG: FAD:protein FMN transferase [Paludibacteraceae bacterium]|nr:FAD:protein FMN transferase [Paludibacteraceae bacterium]
MKKPSLYLYLALLPLLFSCSRAGEYRTTVGLVFGTSYRVQYQSSRDLTENIEHALGEVNASLSTFDTASVISRVNRNEEVEADSLFTKVFLTGQIIALVTGGAFDMTVAPLVNAWGFGFDPQRQRDASVIDSIRAFVGYDKVGLERGRVVKADARTQLDASAIAKGYGCDRVAEALQRCGVRNYLVEIGGELRLAGHNAAGERWRIGVNRAVDDSLQQNHEIQRVLSLTDCGVATSGNYRQFYETAQGRVGHTIDPRTGQPAQGRVLSATVIADECLVADAYATACMVLSDTTAIRSLAEAEGLRVFLIYADETGTHCEWSYPSDEQR